METEKNKVKQWYDGFIFGEYSDIYNPWSILNFLDTGKYHAYWANTSSNSLVSKLLREGNRRMKEKFELLLQGKSIRTPVDEEIVYSQLGENEAAVWSLLLAGGYLKVLHQEEEKWLEYGEEAQYELALTNYEVERMFHNMVRGWFQRVDADYNDFIKAMLYGDLKAMNCYMNEISLEMFSSFDTGIKPSHRTPERFYHGFVLWLLVDLRNRYMITSNRESGYGRYDVMLEPRNWQENDAILLEFKVFDGEEEKSLQDTAAEALLQIEKRLMRRS